MEYVKAVGRGIKNGVNVLAQPVIHPIDTAIEMVVGIWDGWNAIADKTLGISTQGAKERNVTRGQALHEIGEKFVEGNSVTKTEMTTELIVSFAGGGTAAKVGAIGKSVAVERKINKPVKTNDLVSKAIPNQIKMQVFPAVEEKSLLWQRKASSQKVQIHFYKNVRTEEINYNMDYKVKGLIYPLYTTKLQAKKDTEIFNKAYKRKQYESKM